MAEYSAIRGMPARRGPRASKPSSDPLYDRAKHVADILFERAMNLAKVFAPEVPADTEQLDEYDQWNILEATAAAFSPGYWDDPDALDDLYRLRKQFMGVEDPQLKALSKVAKVKRRYMPDPSITPENPEFERMKRRMGGA